MPLRPEQQRSLRTVRTMCPMNCHPTHCGLELDFWNERGEMQARAQVTARIPTGVVWMHDGWRGINQLTSSARQVSDAVAKAFPAGSASYEARVDVQLVARGQ